MTEFALRASFAIVALWRGCFCFALFCLVSEPGSRCRTPVSLSVITKGLQQLHRTLSRIRHYKELALFLLAFWIYNDGRRRYHHQNRHSLR